MSAALKKKQETSTGKPIIGKALSRHVHCAPRKVRLVVDLIRGKSAGEALEILMFTHRPSAVPYVERALKAAIASAAERHPEPNNLIIEEAQVNEGVTMKRIRPASMGRAVRVRKRQSHIFLALAEA